MLQSGVPKNCTNLNIVGDRYDFDPTENIKEGERERRETKHEQSREYVIFTFSKQSFNESFLDICKCS